MNSASERPVGWPAHATLIHRDSVGSTNDEGRQLAVEGAADGTVIWADIQTKGRGRRGRTWVSPQGNLYCSTILRPNKAPQEAAQISLLAAVALGEALCALLPETISVRHKWPNDVLVDGGKIAGILLESSGGGAGRPVDWLVLGCGVNVVSHPKDTLYPATHMTAHDPSVTVAAVLTNFVTRLMVWRDEWNQNGMTPIRQAWLDRAMGLGDVITVRSATGETTGRFLDLDDDGALMLERSDGVIIRIAAGDVFFEGM
jgi:BirA family transcriptional regulator, biotin operon repressor / biotin---[acetyl-CoA-carboxylase] ligase